MPQAMQLIPAIDLKDGQCVRLRQGRMDDASVFSADVTATAQRWVDAGASRLHMVDLDGAFAGEPKNARAVEEVCKAFPDLPVQIGGGIRDESIAQRYIEAGVSYLIIGTQAVSEPDFVRQLCKKWPQQVMVGLDAAMVRLRSMAGPRHPGLTRLLLQHLLKVPVWRASSTPISAETA